MKRLRHTSPDLLHTADGKLGDAGADAANNGGCVGTVTLAGGVTFRFPDRQNAYSQAVYEELQDPKKARAFGRLRASLTDVWRPEFEDDFYLFRWVKARQFDAKKAEQMLRAHLEWRREFGADTILDEFAIPAVLADYYSGGFCGQDREGRPVWYDPIGKSDPEGLARSATRDELIRSRIFVSEWTCRRLLPRIRAAAGGAAIYQLTVVYDMAEFGRRQMWPPSLDLFLELTRICEANYPETMGSAFVINAPSIFPVLFNMLKPLLHKETQNKIHVLADNYQDVLRQYIAPDQLPACFGGERRDPDGDPCCSSCICYGGQVPPDYYLRPRHAGRMEQASVGRRSALKVELTVQPGQTPATVQWEFVTEDGDIGFEIYQLAGDASGSDGQQQQKKFVVQLGRVESDLLPCSGSTLIRSPGLYVAKFDNGHSWTKAKRLSYFLEVSGSSVSLPSLVEPPPAQRRGARLRFIPPEDVPNRSPTPQPPPAAQAPPAQPQQPQPPPMPPTSLGGGGNSNGCLVRQDSQDSFHTACSQLSWAPDAAGVLP